MTFRPTERLLDCAYLDNGSADADALVDLEPGDVDRLVPGVGLLDPVDVDVALQPVRDLEHKGEDREDGEDEDEARRCAAAIHLGRLVVALSPLFSASTLVDFTLPRTEAPLCFDPSPPFLRHKEHHRSMSPPLISVLDARNASAFSSLRPKTRFQISPFLFPFAALREKRLCKAVFATAKPNIPSACS